MLSALSHNILLRRVLEAKMSSRQAFLVVTSPSPSVLKAEECEWRQMLSNVVYFSKEDGYLRRAFITITYFWQEYTTTDAF